MLAVFTSLLDEVGQLAIHLYKGFEYTIEKRVNLWHVLEQTARIGFDSLPIALIISAISGSVLALHAAEKFVLTGAEEYVGGLVALATIREMSPIFTAMAVGARAGTAISAEVANMSVTHQLDALKMMHVSPIRYLLVPRLLACIISMPLLTVLSHAVAIIGGMLMARAAIGQHTLMYLHSVWLMVRWYDIEVSLIKAVIFGALIAGISVTMGLQAKGGARSVGLATTQATVWTSIVVLITDFFLSWMFFGTSFNG